MIIFGAHLAKYNKYVTKVFLEKRARYGLCQPKEKNMFCGNPKLYVYQRWQDGSE